MTRAILSAVKLNFTDAFKYHPMFWAIPVVYAYLFTDDGFFKHKWLNYTLLILIAAGFLINWLFYWNILSFP